MDALGMLPGFVPLSVTALLTISMFFSGGQEKDLKLNPGRPALFLVGGFEAKSVADTFDANRIKVVESTSSGRTSRAYLNSGVWEQVTSQIKPGDFVLIDFQPDTVSANAQSASNRTLPGSGDDTVDYRDPATNKLELVHSFGWYLRKLVVEAINHGAVPILCSSGPSGRSAMKEIAVEQRIPFLDLSGGLRKGLEMVKPDPLEPYLAKPAP
jgi:rhamnogalacturonan acetylesterase